MSQKYTSKDSISIRRSTLYSLLTENKIHVAKINQADITIKKLVNDRKVADSLITLKSKQLDLSKEEIALLNEQNSILNDKNQVQIELINDYVEKNSNFERVIKKKNLQLKIAGITIVALPVGYFIYKWIK